MHDTLLLAKVSGHGMPVLEKLVMHTELAGIKIIAAVSEDVDIRDKENYIWGVFTRFDCERDLIFTEQKLMGVSPIYKGIMGIDATWKRKECVFNLDKGEELFHRQVRRLMITDC